MGCFFPSLSSIYSTLSFQSNLAKKKKKRKRKRYWLRFHVHGTGPIAHQMGTGHQRKHLGQQSHGHGPYQFTDPISVYIDLFRHFCAPTSIICLLRFLRLAVHMISIKKKYVQATFFFKLMVLHEYTGKIIHLFQNKCNLIRMPNQSNFLSQTISSRNFSPDSIFNLDKFY